MKIKNIILLALIIGIFQACGSSNSNSSEKEEVSKVVYVSPSKGVGSSVFEFGGKTCLNTKLNEETNYLTNCNPINGFDYEWGYTYSLDIKETKLDPVPEDSYSSVLSLISIKSKVEDVIGSIYDYKIELYYNTITFENSKYYFYNKEFTCAEGLDCDTLVNTISPFKNSELKFEYIGNSNLKLISYDIEVDTISTISRYIAPYKSIGAGIFEFGERTCLSSKKTEESIYTINCNPINGFDYEWGYTYKLDIEERKLANPYEDVSDTVLSLISIKSKEEDNLGIIYDYQVKLYDYTITTNDSKYYFYDKEFTCAEGLDCSLLVNAVSSSEDNELKFEYLGNSKLKLISFTVIEG